MAVCREVDQLFLRVEMQWTRQVSAIAIVVDSLASTEKAEVVTLGNGDHALVNLLKHFCRQAQEMSRHV